MKENSILKIQPLGFPWETNDPFLFCAYHRDIYPAGDEKLGVREVHQVGRNIGQDFTIKDNFRMYHGSHVPGFPYHPHRGFETITINKEGYVDHSDSLGAAGRFGPGDVQWMTAGKGVQHAEMFPLLNKDKENPLEIFQVWLNLPKAKKMVDPHFKMLWKENIPQLKLKDSEGRQIEIDLIAGNLNDKKAVNPTPESWAADDDNEVMILTLSLAPGAVWELPKANPNLNRTLYFYKGDILMVDQTKVDKNHGVQVDSNRTIRLEAGQETAFLLILQGKPINEPVAQYGPFVMNSQEEIQAAFTDYQQTKFGGWPWPEQEQIHKASKGRFALHADGKKELK